MNSSGLAWFVKPFGLSVLAFLVFGKPHRCDWVVDTVLLIISFARSDLFGALSFESLSQPFPIVGICHWSFFATTGLCHQPMATGHSHWPLVPATGHWPHMVCQVPMDHSRFKIAMDSHWTLMQSIYSINKTRSCDLKLTAVDLLHSELNN